MQEDIGKKYENELALPSDWGWLSVSARHRIILQLLGAPKTPSWVYDEAKKLGIDYEID